MSYSKPPMTEVRKITILIALLFFIVAKAQSQSDRRIDSLNLIIENSVGGKKFDAIISLVRVYGKTDNVTALKYAEQANILACKIGDSAKIVTASRMLGQLYNRLSMNKKAEEILIKNLGTAKRNNFKDDYELMSINLGVAYTFQAKYDVALKTNLEALVPQEEDKDYQSMSITLNNIGLVYFKLKNFEQALEFYGKSLTLKNSRHDTYDLDRLLINIGLCYNQLNDFSKANKYFEDGFNVCGGNCSELIRIEGKFGLAEIYYAIADFSTAEDYFKESLALAKHIGERRFQAENIIYLAMLYRQKRNDISAIKMLRECEQIAREGGYNEILIDVYREFSNIYKQANDFKNMANYQDKYIQLKDSIYGEALTQNLMVAQAEYEQRENTAKIKDQNKILILKEEVIERQKWLSASSVTIAVLLLALVALLYRNNRQKKKINELLEQKVKDRTKELELSYRVLEQNYKEQNNLILKTSNDIRSPLSTMNGLCSLALKELEHEEAQAYVKQMHATTKHLSEIVDKLIR